MSFSHREEKRGERVLDTLTDESAGIRLVVSRLGAELVSLARRVGNEWRGYLYRDNDVSAPASRWANHATVMGYYLHRLKDGRSLYRSREIIGGTHSFLREKTWRLIGIDSANQRVTYGIDRADFTDDEYPLNVSLDLSYEIAGEGVRVTFRFRNHEPELDAHVEFGLHPGFAAASFESFQFNMPAGIYRRHFSPTNYLSGETADIEIEIDGGPMAFAREKLAGSYILEFVDVPDRVFEFRDPESGRAVEIDLAECPYLTLWSDGGPFLCVEPCWGLTDHHQQRAFEDKEGIQVISAGGELTRSFTITPRALSL